MILPAPGVAFTSHEEGDMLDRRAVDAVASALGITSDWATVSQVHGAHLCWADAGGPQGEGDAIVTFRTGLPVAIRTADCVGVVGTAGDRVGAAHAGWRGLSAGILHEFREVMGDNARYYIGPSIGPCCYEVGKEVASRFPDHLAVTTDGRQSVDLRAAARSVLGSIEWEDDRCTHCSDDLPSHRRNGTSHRIAAIGWR